MRTTAVDEGWRKPMCARWPGPPPESPQIAPEVPESPHEVPVPVPETPHVPGETPAVPPAEIPEPREAVRPGAREV